MTFIFDWWQSSSAAATPVKHEHDNHQVTGVLMTEILVKYRNRRNQLSDHCLKAMFTHARSGDRRIFTFPLRYLGYVHTYAVRTWADLPFLEDKDGWERAVLKRMRKIGCWTHLLRSGVLLPLRLCSATVYVWTHVMICVEANFLPASAPRMCERAFRLPSLCPTFVSPCCLQYYVI